MFEIPGQLAAYGLLSASKEGLIDGAKMMSCAGSFLNDGVSRVNGLLSDVVRKSSLEILEHFVVWVSHDL